MSFAKIKMNKREFKKAWAKDPWNQYDEDYECDDDWDMWKDNFDFSHCCEELNNDVLSDANAKLIIHLGKKDKKYYPITTSFIRRWVAFCKSIGCVCTYTNRHITIKYKDYPNANTVFAAFTLIRLPFDDHEIRKARNNARPILEKMLDYLDNHSREDPYKVFVVTCYLLKSYQEDSDRVTFEYNNLAGIPRSVSKAEIKKRFKVLEDSNGVGNFFVQYKRDKELISTKILQLEDTKSIEDQVKLAKQLKVY